MIPLVKSHLPVTPEKLCKITHIRRLLALLFKKIIVKKADRHADRFKRSVSFKFGGEYDETTKFYLFVKVCCTCICTTLDDFTGKKLKCLVILSTTCWLKNLTCIFFKKLANVCYIRENTRELKSCLVISSTFIRYRCSKQKRYIQNYFRLKSF